MAVFPDRIVLKNSTDSHAVIEAAIGPGGSDEITQGEIVLGILDTDVKFYTKAGDGSIVALGGTGTGPYALGELTDVDLSTPATDGQVIAYNSTSGNWEPADQGSGAVALNDLTDVSYTSGSLAPDALDEIVFSSADVPTGETYKVYANENYGMALGAYDASVEGSFVYAHATKGVELRSDTQLVNIVGNNDATNNTPEIRLNTGGPNRSTPTGHYFGLKLPGGYNTDQTYIVPAVDGTSGQVLSTDGSGTLSWANNLGGGGLANIVEDTTPQLGGNLDTNSFYITSVSGDVTLAPATGEVVVRGGTSEGKLTLNCTANTHGVSIQSPPHADAATYTLVLPSTAGTAGQVLTSQGGAQLTWEDAGSGGATSINDLTDVDTNTTPPTQDQVLIWNGTNWVPGDQTGGSGGGGGSGAGIYLTESQTASGGTADFTGLGYSGILQKVSSDLDAWIVLYSSAAERTADAGRAYNTDPTPGSGVLFEAYVTAGGTVVATPGTTYLNNDTTLTEAVYAAVRDQAGAAVNASVTFSAYGLAAITAVNGGTFGSGV